MNKLIVLSACPGSGKSTWAKRYSSTHPNTVILSSDEVRKQITGTYTDFSKQDQVWNTIRSEITRYSHIDNVDLILDACIDLNELRVFYANLGKDFTNRTLIVICKPLEEVIENNKKRNPAKFVPEDVLIKLFNKFELPTDEVIKCYDNYVFINRYFK